MRTAYWSLTLAATLALGSGCNRNRADTEVDPDRPTMLKVDNQGFYDMTIYVLPETGQRLRLGLANGHSETMFTLPRHLTRSLTSLRFLADPIGGNRTPVSEEVQVNPGDEIVLRIPPS